jgi:hypothetical protein
MSHQVTHTVESITQLLMTNDVALGRALVALFNRQTQDEKTLNTTNVHNARGFTGSDGYSGCMAAKTFIKRGSSVALSNRNVAQAECQGQSTHLQVCFSVAHCH